MKTTILATLSLALGLSFAAAPEAQAARLLLGQTTLTDQKDSDVLDMAGDCKRVAAIQLRVLRKPAEIDVVMLRYENGVWDELPVREYFAVGSTSAVFNLPGGIRCVDKIYIKGDAETRRVGSAPSVVQFFGYR